VPWLHLAAKTLHWWLWERWLQATSPASWPPVSQVVYTHLTTVKVKEMDLYSTILWAPHLQCAQVYGSHSFTCKLHHTSLYLVSVHQMALPLSDGRHLIAAYYSYIDPERIKGWVGLVGWPIADTHISGNPSVTSVSTFCIAAHTRLDHIACFIYFYAHHLGWHACFAALYAGVWVSK